MNIRVYLSLANGLRPSALGGRLSVGEDHGGEDERSRHGEGPARSNRIRTPLELVGLEAESPDHRTGDPRETSVGQKLGGKARPCPRILAHHNLSNHPGN